ncbi:MAG: ABC transporter ATP-binding protein [Syntrophomonadaceae bacterium]|jgi:putative ABC transport system ATP-binding protein
MREGVHIQEFIIKIQGLSKIYKVGNEKVRALDNISLEIEEGKIYCILGTSGSGKSTLLYLMAGLEKPSRGSIVINGHHLEKMSETQLAHFRQKYIGFIFQSFNLLPNLTALENVSLPLVFRGKSPAARERRARKMLTAVGLPRHLRHKPSQMSGGQQQRVGIARAFVSKPPIILADEPTGNLDSRTTAQIMQLMIGMVQENQQTLIIVTHDYNVAAYADQVIHILDGQVERIVHNKNYDISEAKFNEK